MISYFSKIYQYEINTYTKHFKTYRYLFFFFFEKVSIFQYIFLHIKYVSLKKTNHIKTIFIIYVCFRESESLLQKY